jgi:hypothetical protein
MSAARSFRFIRKMSITKDDFCSGSRVAGFLARICTCQMTQTNVYRSTRATASKGMSSRSDLMWFMAGVVGLFSIILLPFSVNLASIGQIFSANVAPNRRMSSRPAIYVLVPLQVDASRSSHARGGSWLGK